MHSSLEHSLCAFMAQVAQLTHFPLCAHCQQDRFWRSTPENMCSVAVQVCALPVRWQRGDKSEQAAGVWHVGDLHGCNHHLAFLLMIVST